MIRDYQPTVGFEHSQRILEVNNRRIKLEIVNLFDSAKLFRKSKLEVRIIR